MVSTTGNPALAGALAQVEPSITIKDCAELMGIDPATVRRLLNSGQLRGYRAGMKAGAIRVYVSSIVDYQADNQIVSAAIKPPPAQHTRKRSTTGHRDAMAALADLGIQSGR